MRNRSRKPSKETPACRDFTPYKPIAKHAQQHRHFAFDPDHLGSPPGSVVTGLLAIVCTYVADAFYALILGDLHSLLVTLEGTASVPANNKPA